MQHRNQGIVSGVIVERKISQRGGCSFTLGYEAYKAPLKFYVGKDLAPMVPEIGASAEVHFELSSRAVVATGDNGNYATTQVEPSIKRIVAAGGQEATEGEQPRRRMAA